MDFADGKRMGCRDVTGRARVCSSDKLSGFFQISSKLVQRVKLRSVVHVVARDITWPKTALTSGTTDQTFEKILAELILSLVAPLQQHQNAFAVDFGPQFS
jgi:hypothetical protein